MLKINKIDIILISETHTNDRKSFKLENYNVYTTNHPDSTSHGGTSVIIKSNIKHYLHSEHRENYLQATTVTIEDLNGNFNVSAVYCPPRHKITEEMFGNYFGSLGKRYITGGDWNSKHTFWGSRLITTRGRELMKCITSLRLETLSNGEPTYWPTDQNKIPDLLDFFIHKGLPHQYVTIDSCLDTSSDHTPVICTLSMSVIYQTQINLYNNNTDWQTFSEFLESKVNLKVSLKSEKDLDEATFFITNLIQESAWRATPFNQNAPTKFNIPLEIRRKLEEKRKLRRLWQLSRLKDDRMAWNKAARELREMLNEHKNYSLQHRLSTLSATRNGNYTLWKITKEFKRPQLQVPPLKNSSGVWVKTPSGKAELFAEHLENVFSPNEANDEEFESEIERVINSDQQLSPPLKLITPKEVARTIRHLPNKKAPGFDLITGEVLKHLPRKALVFLTMVFNAINRLCYYPKLWKISVIRMMPKPGKSPIELNSYRPISLLPTISKIFEKILLTRLKPVLKTEHIIPDHQFGFRSQHSTVEQVHRVVNAIRQSLERKEYCCGVFLDIQQAFDKVWHKGLLYKLKILLPNSFYMVLKSYLHSRKFMVKFEEEFSKIYDIRASVPQGSVLGPILYSIYTSDLPVTQEVLTATYADDTACLSSDKDPDVASAKLQLQLDKVDQWLQRWRIKSSSTKSTQMTFTLRRGDCKPVTMGNQQLPSRASAKYLGFHLDRRLTWASHIKAKRQEANVQYQKLYWLIGRQSAVSLTNKLLIYKSIIKPIWTYGLELWGSASNSNLEILQRFQNYILRMISNAPWYARNTEIHEYLGLPTVKEEIVKYCTKYKERLRHHTNNLAQDLLKTDEQVARLKRWQILNLDQRH